MYRLVILLVVCCSFSFVKCDETTDEKKLCSENESFLQEGYGCQTCQRLLVKCALEKEAKCYCNPGYVRDKVSGKCVEYAECKKITGEENFCKVNETYAQDGFNCQTCDNYAVVRCAGITEPQCICIPGYVHNELTGFCVQTADCPEPHKLCSENESYLQEGYACQTCQKLIVKCAVEKEPNCYCNSGYVRDTVSGKCVEYAECEKITGEENYCKVNETYAQEGYNCQTCNNYALVFCIGIQEPQCICTPGYVRNEETGFCVQTADCPKPLRFPPIDPLCGLNEIFKLKGTDCATCENYKYVRCAPQDNPRCYCQDDYVRNDNNVCTLKADCPP